MKCQALLIRNSQYQDPKLLGVPVDKNILDDITAQILFAQTVDDLKLPASA